MPTNVENTRVEGDFAQESPKTGQKMPEKPINTRAEDAFEKAEKEYADNITEYLKYFQMFWQGGETEFEELDLLQELAEGMVRNLKDIQRARVDAIIEGGKSDGTEYQKHIHSGNGIYTSGGNLATPGQPEEKPWRLDGAVGVRKKERDHAEPYRNPGPLGPKSAMARAGLHPHHRT